MVSRLEKGVSPMRRFVVAAALVALTVGFAFSDTFVGNIQSFKDGKISVKKYDATDKKYEDIAKDFKVAKDAKVYKKSAVKGEFPGELDAEGVKSDVLNKIGAKGLVATITTDDKGVVTEIKAGKAGKKKAGAE